MTTVAQCLRRGTTLSAVSDTPRLDCELLLSHVLEKDRTWLYTWPETTLNENQRTEFEALFQRRQQGEPIAYILGYREFWSLPLAVNSSTLIPRPETELLVELVLQTLPADDHCRVLDLGTGTGAIALAIASERPHWDITAVDKSIKAVALATCNRDALSLTHVRCLQSDWFDQLDDKQFDVIVANPPYIADDDRHLQQGDVRFEPSSALVSANDGMADLTRIIQQAQHHLSPGGCLMVEHGYQQANNVQLLMSMSGLTEVTSHRDLAGHWRVTVGCS